MKPIFRPLFRGLCLLAATAPTAFAEESVDSVKSETAELRQQIQDLSRLVKDLQQQVATRPTAAEPPTPSAPPIAVPPAPEVDLTTAILPPPKQSSASLFNPEISAAVDAIGSYSDSANNANFTVRDIELMIQSNVDQLARAYVVFNAESELDPWTKTDPFGDVSLGVEEAAIETTALPYGLALKAGQFFADFSRLGKVHSHDLPFTDRPASLEGIIGGESKARGVELSWVPPLGHYARFTLGAVDQIGAETSATGLISTIEDGEQSLFAGSSNRALGDITYYGRAATIFELSESSSLNLGVDYAHGKDQGTRQLASADFKLTWLPDAASFNRFEAGGELLHGKSDGSFGPNALLAGQPTSGDSVANGAYVYAQYRIGKNWEPGIRYDTFSPETWSQTDSDSTDNEKFDGRTRTRQTQSSWSAYVNYNLSEYSRLRLGASHVTGSSGAFNGKDDDWLGFLQWTIIVGAHQHSFQP